MGCFWTVQALCIVNMVLEDKERCTGLSMVFEIVREWGDHGRWQLTVVCVEKRVSLFFFWFYLSLGFSFSFSLLFLLSNWKCDLE